MVEEIVGEVNLEGVFYSDKLYDFHKYCIKFPRMRSDQIIEISESILEFGQLNDIILLDNLILDGRHLYWACKAAGITPRFRNFDSNLHPWAYVKIKNLYRRDLTTAQRVGLALEDLKIEREITKERQMQSYFKDKNKQQKNDEKYTVNHPRSPTVTDTKKGKTVDIVAKERRIAPKSLRKAVKINKIAKRNPFIKRYWEWAKNEDIPLEEIARTIRKALDYHNSKKLKKYEKFNKVIKIYEASKFDPTIEEQLEIVKKGEISLYDADQNTKKINSFKKSIRRHNADNFTEILKVYEKNSLPKKKRRQEEVSKEENDGEDDLSNDNIHKPTCRSCSEAYVFLYKCFKCGALVQCNCGEHASWVNCKYDYINGVPKYRDPNKEIYKNSLDFDLFLKKVV